jgi:hypothetical protein
MVAGRHLWHIVCYFKVNFDANEGTEMLPLLRDYKLFSIFIFMFIFSASPSFAFESSKFKLTSCGTEKELNAFCKNHQYEGYSSIEKHEGYCYVICFRNSDGKMDVEQFVPFDNGSFVSFNDFLDKLITNGDYCSAEKQVVRQRSRELLDNTLKHEFEDPQIENVHFQNDNEFADLVVDRWEKIFKHLAKTQTDIEGVPSIMRFVSTALNRGVIPLPATHENDREGKNLHSFTNLSKYMPLGIFPIDLVKRTDAGLAGLEAHPLRTKYFASTNFQFAQHDILHAELVGGHYQRLKTSVQCKRLSSCFNHLTEQQDDNKRAYNRIMSYFLLHESRNPINEPDLAAQRGFGTENFNEFALEMVTSKPKFALDLLLGENDEEVEKTCRNITYIQAREDEINELGNKTKPSFSYDDFKSVTRRRMMLMNQLGQPESGQGEWKKAIGLAQVLTEKTQFFENVGSSEDKNSATFKYMRDQSFHGLVYKLGLKCRSKYPNLDVSDNGMLAVQFEKFKQNGFMKAMDVEMTKMTEALERIKSKLKESPCKELFN